MLLLFALCDLGALFLPAADWDLHAEGLRERREGNRDIGVGVGVCVSAGVGAEASAGASVGKLSWDSEKTSNLTAVSTGEGDGEE